MFQVPKGMLQTKLCIRITRLRIKQFQVPKGMLQTGQGQGRKKSLEAVSSPQGNATNSASFIRISPPTSRSFKSPRECYKRICEDSHKCFFWVFQVPKGMLQTNPCPSYGKQWNMFQVPKGMLQTYFSISSHVFTKSSFKSPRECYKRCLSVFLYHELLVSSPQGNATNSMLIPGLR